MVNSENFLVDNAYNTVWCGPGQDRQHILAPTRLTGVYGSTYRCRIGMSVYNLPTQGPTYDVFTFGDVLPESVGLDPTVNAWISAKAHCESRKLLIHLYNNHGVRFPLQKAWFLYTRSGSLIVATERLVNLPHFGRTQLYVRWRSAAYFASEDAEVNLGVRVGYLKYAGNNSAYATYRQQWLTHAALGYGRAIAFVNGYRIRDYNPANLRVGDHLEWIFDGDVKEVVEYKYSELFPFTSTLDNSTKFLIPRRREDNEVDFVDDMDFNILHYTKPLEYTGIYFHQNQVDAIRMVTHKDYALKANYLNSAIQDQQWPLDADIRIEVVVRHSGMNRSLQFEHHRIKELLKLPEVKRVAAMVTEDGGVDVWKATQLESSSYLQLMSAKLGDITPETVIDAYGYNAVARLTGMIPLKVATGLSHVDLFYGQYTQSTVYEYNADRQLIGWYPHSQAKQYPIQNGTCRYIEAYAGTGGEGLSTAYNTHTSSIPFVLRTDYNYRFYKGRVELDGRFTEWVDVTGDDTVYTVVANQVLWKNQPANTVTAIRNDRDFLSKDIELPSNDGILIFSIGVEETLPGRQNTYQLMDIPPGELDVFLNGYGLVEDIDYYVKWPEICIVSKRFWIQPALTQKVTVRGRGFCTSDLKRNEDQESGLIIHGQLSRNGRHNVRDDKVTRVSLGGRLYTTDEIGFAEDGTVTPDVPNGLPYRITHPYIPLTPVVPGDTYVYRQASIAVDEAIEGYLDIHLPEPPMSPPNAIQDRYTLISPFSSKVIEDILAGYITMEDFEGEYSQQDVANRLAGYSYLLEYDPVLRETRTDLFVFHPHRHDNVELTTAQFRFVSVMINVFLLGRIELNRYATIVN